MVSSAIQNAQSQVESRNTEQRKNVLKYDDVMNRQREAIYTDRRRILEGDAASGIHAQLDRALAEHVRSGLRGERIALGHDAVDDDADTRELVEVVLARYGADVRMCASAAEALDALEGWDAQVLVSDIGMPDEDGFSLIRTLRASPSARLRRIPAVAMTAYARPADRASLLSAGFQMHLAKPVDPAELVAAVASLRGGSRP